LITIRNYPLIQWGAALRFVMRGWISTAQRMESTTLANSAKETVAIFLTSRPAMLL